MSAEGPRHGIVWKHRRDDGTRDIAGGDDDDETSPKPTHHQLARDKRYQRLVAAGQEGRLDVAEFEERLNRSMEDDTDGRAPTAR